MTDRTIHDLQTPALLVDRDRLASNCERMESRCRDLGVRLRPHVKTAKSVDVARLLPSAWSHGITVSTVREAEHFVGAGVEDVLYAVTVTPDKLPRLARLTEGGARVRLAVDSLEMAVAIPSRAVALGVTFDVLVEIDCGEHRSGVPADSGLLLEIARAVHEAEGTLLAGVYTHGGHAYECRNADAIRAVAADERRAVVLASQRLRDAGLPCEVVSVGSTPTLTFADGLDGVTEARAGVFTFQDLYQVGLGVCGLDDVAASVLTTVIGHQRDHGTLLIDAGGLALSKDRGTAGFGTDGDCGYGLLTDAAGTDVVPEVMVEDVFQEHGVVRGAGLSFDRFPIGSRLRVLPNHACMTAAQYSRYHVVHEERVVATWNRVNEWE